jgi:hypothetical protein
MFQVPPLSPSSDLDDDDDDDDDDREGPRNIYACIFNIEVSGCIVVKALCCKPEGHRFKSR